MDFKIFEYPYTFKVNNSLLFLILTKNHMLEIKSTKGKSLIIRLGTNIIVSNNGIKIFAPVFLKNSTSSNKFKIIPKQ